MPAQNTRVGIAVGLLPNTFQYRPIRNILQLGCLEYAPIRFSCYLPGAIALVPARGDPGRAEAGFAAGGGGVPAVASALESCGFAAAGAGCWRAGNNMSEYIQTTAAARITMTTPPIASFVRCELSM
jgi:hypothetical protein